MADSDHPAPGGQGNPDDRYYGPFGPPPEDPYAPRGPGFDSAPTWAAPAPPPAPPIPLVAATALPGSGRRGLRGGSVVAVAALTAVVIGGAAGYGGSRLAGGSSAAAPVSASSPTTGPVGPSASTPDPSTSASPLAPAPAQANTVEIARRVVPATVMIQVGNGTGSGFVLDKAGRIMTNNHVVAEAADGTKIKVVLADGRRQSATLLGRSPSYDLAVIKVDAPGTLTPLPVGRSASLAVGQPVIAVGAPLGLPGTVTQGIVSAKDRPVVVNASSAADAPTAYINAIQTDAPINPGNSGGPLVDAGGRVIGVNSAILTLGAGQGQNGNIGLGFAIPIDQATAIGKQLIARGKARYPVIGATVADGSTSGVQLESVERGGPAADAGLRPGDVVTKIDDRSVTTMEELIVTVRTHLPGDSVVLDYTRGSSRRSAKVTLGSKEG
ncbi:S1C family serine protease [uncultured Friedmanniella sp.]|uniref:S1C family serine protease n=1 Tax=uncultured Friedmanniella sp. TaxID=335381 RepID=UPI0035C9900A